MNELESRLAVSLEIARVGTWDWQLALALICVAWAMVALVRRMRRWLFGKAALGCGPTACDRCANQPKPDSSPAEPQLVSIRLPR